ncbi:retrovirus-related pol polyprotein from transposon TNT 1-94 [Tanacetum coccineum]
MLNYVNDMNSRGKKQKANVSNTKNQKKQKPKKVGSNERLASPKPSKPRFCLRWSPTGRLFDIKGKIIASSESESQSDCSNGDNACTSNPSEPKIKRFPNSTSFLGRLSKFVYGKSKRASHPPKPVPNSKQRLHLLHMDLCGPMRIASINGKRYVLVIVDDYSRYTWVHFLRSKDEAPEVIKTFLKRITVLLQSPVIIIRTDNGTEFKNQILKEYFDSVGISHQASSVRTPQQNGVVERRNRTLVEAARTMLIFSRAPLFLWAEAIATACFTQNRSIIHRRFNKTPYELINGRKPDISFLHVFGALCYPKNDREDFGKLGAKGDIGFFIGYSADSCAYRVYNRRTKKIMETMNVTFDELSAMAFEQSSSKPGLQRMTSGQISSGLDLTYAPSTITTQKPTEGELDLLFEAMYDDYIGGQSSSAPRTAPAAQAPQVLQTPTATTTTADTAPTPTNSSSQATNFSNSSQDVDELETQQHAQHQPATTADNVPNAMFDENTFVNPFATPSTSDAESSSSQYVDPSNMHTFYQPYPHEFQWTKDHPLEQVIGEPSRPVLTRNQLRSDGDMCMYALTVSTVEPKNVKEAMTDPAWIESMQEELLQFKRLDVWVLVPLPDNIKPLTGYRQEEGIDLKILRSVARNGSYQVHDADHPSHVYKLKKALYGLKQAPRAWSMLMILSLVLHTLVNQSSRGIFINQSNYVIEILKKYGMETCDSRWYLMGTVNTGLWYTKDSGFELTGFLDADYAVCKDTFKSTSGGAQFLGEKLVSWSSKKQDCTALSTAEAEYVSLSVCCAQVLWMRTQLTDYGFYFNKIPIYCDSKSAIAISCNPVQHSRTKHIAVRYHFIKEHVEMGTIELYFVKTVYQLAGLFTICIPGELFGNSGNTQCVSNDFSDTLIDFSSNGFMDLTCNISKIKDTHYGFSQRRSYKPGG